MKTKIEIEVEYDPIRNTTNMVRVPLDYHMHQSEHVLTLFQLLHVLDFVRGDIMREVYTDDDDDEKEE